jgi:predicted enzyme related to lactoylglutathione lyase
MAEDWARPVVHFEIQGREPQRLREFYGQLFNWQIGEGPIMTIPAGIGGPPPGPGGHIRQGDHPGVSLYIQVLDLRASLEKAQQLGGSVFLQPVDTPGGQTIAGIADPEGTRVMLVQQ